MISDQFNGNADLFINQRGDPGRSPANPTSGNPAKLDFRVDFYLLDLIAEFRFACEIYTETLECHFILL